jgi:excisionase family DNA binding protein
MKQKTLGKDWFKEIAKGNPDLDKILPAGRRALAPPPSSTEDVPPFRASSRLPLFTREEAAGKLEVGVSTLDRLIRDRLIFPHYRGRLVRVSIEEIENYNQREAIERERKRHA